MRATRDAQSPLLNGEKQIFTNLSTGRWRDRRARYHCAIGYASLAENMARSGEISRIWGPSIIAHNTTRRSHGQDLLRVWLQPSFRRGEMFVFPLPYPCYTTWALGKTVQVKFLMIDTINLDMNDPGKRKTRPDSTEFSLFFCNLGFSAT